MRYLENPWRRENGKDFFLRLLLVGEDDLYWMKLIISGYLIPLLIPLQIKKKKVWNTFSHCFQALKVHQNLDVFTWMHASWQLS